MYIYIYIYIFFFFTFILFPHMGVRAPRKGRESPSPYRRGGKPPHLMLGKSALYMPTTAGVPRRKPIQVLTRPNVA